MQQIHKSDTPKPIQARTETNLISRRGSHVSANDYAGAANGNNDDGLCPICHGAGWLVADTATCRDADFGKLIPCACLKARRTQTLTGRLPERLRRCTLETFHTFWQRDCRKRDQLEGALATVTAFATDPYGWLYIHSRGGSGCGTGKSHLAAAAAQAINNTGYQVIFKRVPEILRDATGAWEERAARLDVLCRVDVLVLDDLGKEYASSKSAQDYRNSVLFDILDARYANERITLMTANYSPDELDTRGYSPAIISRIGSALMVTLTGDDYRRRA